VQALTKKILSRLAIGMFLLVILAAVLGIAFFKAATHRVASRLTPPTLERETKIVPDLAYRTLDGELHHVSESKGKVVFLDLWGTWCIQCIAEMPTVQDLYNHYRNDPQVEFLIVSRLDSPSTVRSYARRNHFELPFYVTRDEDVPDSMYLRQYPATFIYSKNGSIAVQHAGGANWADESVISLIEQLKAK
jgi:thiol-disulfide isomerase/thioredoxin